MFTKKTLIVLLSIALALSLGMLTGCEEGEPETEEAIEEPLEEPSEEELEDTKPFFAKELDDSQRMQSDSNMVRNLDTKLFTELADNRMGNVDFMREDDYIYEPGFIKYHVECGLKWVRLGIDHAIFTGFDLKERGHSTRLEDRHISTIKGFDDAGINVICCLIYWDIKAGGQEIYSTQHYTPHYKRFREEQEVERFLEFVRETVRELKGSVAYYELLNEQNVPPALYYYRGTQQDVRLPDYINLIKRTVPVIKEEDPEAKIAVGAVGNIQKGWDDIGGLGYLFGLLESEAMPLVDAVTFHPMYNITPQGEELHKYVVEVDYGDHKPMSPEEIQAYYDSYPELLQELYETAVEHGFSGVFIADEISYWSPAFIRAVDLHYPAPNLVFPEIQAAKYHVRAIMLHLGMDMMAIATAENHPIVIRNLSTVMSGHEAINILVELEIDYEVPVAYCSFRYPNGDRMLAIWTDDVAVDEDSGVPAKITFPGITAQSVTGIDVLHGLEHKLSFEVDGESTVVSDILVKDYPIMIHLVNPEMSDEFEETTGPGFHRLNR